MNSSRALLVWILAAAILQCACGGGNSGGGSAGGAGGGSGGTGGGTGGGGGGGSGGGGTGGSGSSIPLFSHVFLLVEENHSFNDVVGSTGMPYLNGLIAANALATEYYADAHPSLPNYFMLTAGAGTSITGTEGDSFSGPVTQDNVVRALTAAGKTWKIYAESLPAIGYIGVDTGEYAKRHNPFAYFSDVINSSTQAANMVPFSQLATDIANNAVPDYAFIVPNLNDDAHDCPAGLSTCTDLQKLAAADQWLQTNIDPVIKSSVFQD